MSDSSQPPSCAGCNDLAGIFQWNSLAAFATAVSRAAFLPGSNPGNTRPVFRDEPQRGSTPGLADRMPSLP